MAQSHFHANLAAIAVANPKFPHWDSCKDFAFVRLSSSCRLQKIHQLPPMIWRKWMLDVEDVVLVVARTNIANK
jgi:hypothetical protein